MVVHAGGVHRDQDAMVLIPENKGSPHARTRHRACVVQEQERLGGYNPTHRVDGLPSLVDLFPFPSPALVHDPYLCPSRVVASSRN